MNTSCIDSALGEVCRKIGETCQEKSRCCEEAVRRSPLGGVACAALAGYLLQKLPLLSIAGGLMGVVARLLKPALLIYGAVKLWEHFRPVREEGPALTDREDPQ